MTESCLPSPPLVVGWKEYLDLPDWDITGVRAKIDTGARTSALDVAGYELWHDADLGGLRIRLRLALRRRRLARLTTVEAPVLAIVAVRNSGGACEHRPLIETVIRLGPVQKRIRLTVTNRSAMRFRMILGRQALAGDFQVDVARTYLLRRTRNHS